MLYRSSLSRSAQLGLGLGRQCRRPGDRRGLASLSYETGDAAGVKFASRDLPGPTTTVFVVSRAGSRYQPLPVYSEALAKFAFKSTQRRTAVRINREAELLGSQLISYHTRENVVVGAKFLKDDLPYFTELLAEVVSQTKFTAYELAEDVIPNIKLTQKLAWANAPQVALDSAHAVAFHRGLGSTLSAPNASPAKYLHNEGLQQFASAAYAKSNFAIVASGANPSDFAKWTKEFFSGLSGQALPGAPALNASPSKYYGGEERIAHEAGNAVVIAFPGSSLFTGSAWKPEIAVLAELLGGKPSVKWSSGFSLLAKAAEAFPGTHVSTGNAGYTDAGLLHVTLSGSASGVKAASAEVVKKIKAVAAGELSSEDFKKAVAAAKFAALSADNDALAGLELTGTGLVHGGKAHQSIEAGKSIESVSESQLKAAAKALLENKATVSTVGDLSVLPYAEEIGLTV